MGAMTRMEQRYRWHGVGLNQFAAFAFLSGGGSVHFWRDTGVVGIGTDQCVAIAVQQFLQDADRRHVHI